MYSDFTQGTGLPFTDKRWSGGDKSRLFQKRAASNDERWEVGDMSQKSVDSYFSTQSVSW